MFSNHGFSHLHLLKPDKLSTKADNDSFMCLALSINLKLYVSSFFLVIFDLAYVFFLIGMEKDKLFTI